MRVVIAGAGAVGRSVAQELIDNGHTVLLIDKSPTAIRADIVPKAQWLLADACELSSLEEAHLESSDVVISATGDDKANLVISLLAKTEFAVPRTVGRVNHPSNEWLFSESWGVDVSVSTPRLMAALVEEAVAVGDLVRLFTFRQSNTNLVELTMPEDSPFVGSRVSEVPRRDCSRERPGPRRQSAARQTTPRHWRVPVTATHRAGPCNRGGSPRYSASAPAA